MLAWMFENGSGSQQLSPLECAKRAKAHGYEWLALEYDDLTFDPVKWYPHFRDACRIHELLPLVWFTEGSNIYKTPGDAAGCIAEIEGPGDLEGVTNVIKGQGGGPLPTVPLAVCTNFSTMNRENARPLIQAGFECLTESYINEAPGMTPDNMDRVAKSLGWATSQPVFGMYPVGGQPVPSYAEWQDWPGVDYLAEYTL
jgi:hypothetical protein